MTTNNWLIETDELESTYSADLMTLIDLGKAETYAAGHIPGAIHLDYADIVSSNPPVMGLLPDANTCAKVLSRVGYSTDKEMIAYDDEGGGRAARLAWSLNAYGLKNIRVLNGGIHAWAGEQRPMSSEIPMTESTDVSLSYTGDGVADKEFILAHLNDNAYRCLDARSVGEYNATDVRAARGGRIPGAIHFEWTLAMDPDNFLRLRDAADLHDMLSNIGLTPDKHISCYCQTHHRSAHSWLVLKHLGYKHVYGYPGAWSDWGNDSNTPVEA